MRDGDDGVVSSMYSREQMGEAGFVVDVVRTCCSFGLVGITCSFELVKEGGPFRDGK
jgi:hypothetical protein